MTSIVKTESKKKVVWVRYAHNICRAQVQKVLQQRFGHYTVTNNARSFNVFNILHQRRNPRTQVSEILSATRAIAIRIRTQRR